MTEPLPSKKLTCTVNCAVYAAFAMFLACMFCWWFLEIDEEIRVRFAKWESRKWINATYNDVLNITDDERLIQLENPHVEVGGTLQCVSAHAKQVLGSTLSYEEVVDNYTHWLTKHGWKQQVPPQPNRYVFHLPSNKLPPGDTYKYVRVISLSPYNLEDDTSTSKEKSPTIYIVEINFYEKWCLAG